MADKELYADGLGGGTWFTSGPLITFSGPGASEAQSDAATAREEK